MDQDSLQERVERILRGEKEKSMKGNNGAPEGERNRVVQEATEESASERKREDPLQRIKEDFFLSVKLEKHRNRVIVPPL